MTAGTRKTIPLNILPQYTCPNPGKKNEPAAHRYGSLSFTAKVSPTICSLFFSLYTRLHHVQPYKQENNPTYNKGNMVFQVVSLIVLWIIQGVQPDNCKKTHRSQTYNNQTYPENHSLFTLKQNPSLLLLLAPPLIKDFIRIIIASHAHHTYIHTSTFNHIFLHRILFIKELIEFWKKHRS